METNQTNHLGKYKYINLYLTLKKHFNINEEKYGDYIKDSIKILMDHETNGESLVNIDEKLKSIDLLKQDWPEGHIKALVNSGLINKTYSPIIYKNSKLSWQKWSSKIQNISEKFLSKINSKKIKESERDLESFSDIEKIKRIFKLSNIVFLQGGPGTGKSTLIISLILNYLESNKFFNIGICAPTGKATARLKESLDKKKSESANKNLEQIECQTLHRWIYNSNNKTGRIKFRLKELDFFIVDEMSMVSIDLIDSFMDLLAKDCKILLVGDANQLPPINNCSIWNYIFENRPNKVFNLCTVNLHKTYRNNGDIEKLSKSIFNKDQKFFNRTFNDKAESTNSSSNVKIIECKNYKVPNNLILEIKESMNKLNLKASELSEKKYLFQKSVGNLLNYEKELIIEIFNELNSHLILCETNTGIMGVQSLNEIIIKQKEPYDFISLDEGLPIMCTENNNELGIANGDIGILVGSNSNRKLLFKKFGKNNEPVFFLIEPKNLEKIIPAIAITIHKSQGSEAKKVSLLWTKQNNKRINFFNDNYEKRLFYTAITRAQENLNIYNYGK